MQLDESKKLKLLILYGKCIGLNETLKVMNPNSECELSLVRHMSDNLKEAIVLLIEKK